MWEGASCTMKTIEFKQLDETLYYEKLENGLDVYILPKKKDFLKHLSHSPRSMALLIVHLCRLVKQKALQYLTALPLFRA